MNRQTFTIVIDHGDSIAPFEVENFIDSAMQDVDAMLFDHTTVDQSYSITVNGDEAFFFEGQDHGVGMQEG